jgi:diadenosine tetraphosphate (Ap4A) HIT family hydrolase
VLRGPLGLGGRAKLVVEVLIGLAHGGGSPHGTESMSSPFLDRPPSQWIASNRLAFAIRDAFPVSPGHTLVVPRRLVSGWFEATAEERQALLDLVDEVRRQLDTGPAPPRWRAALAG